MIYVASYKISTKNSFTLEVTKHMNSKVDHAAGCKIEWLVLFFKSQLFGIKLHLILITKFGL
jgi:hypothetical protein